MVKAWWRRTSWKRVVLCILLTFLGLWIVAIGFDHVHMWNLTRDIAGSDSRLKLVPQSLPDRSLADIHGGVMLNRFGYSLQVPWKNLMGAKDFKGATFFTFDDGSLLIESPTSYFDMITSASNDSNAMRDGFRPILGDEATRSHYDYAKAELETRPSDASFFSLSNRRVYLLLAMKPVAIPPSSTAIFSINMNGLRGFQFGDPTKIPTVIKLLLFDEQDRALRVTLRGSTDSRQPVLTQEQINAIVASIRPTN